VRIACRSSVLTLLFANSGYISYTRQDICHLGMPAVSTKRETREDFEAPRETLVHPRTISADRRPQTAEMPRFLENFPSTVSAPLLLLLSQALCTRKIRAIQLNNTQHVWTRPNCRVPLPFNVLLTLFTVAFLGRDVEA